MYYWIWVNLKQITFSPFSFRGTNSFRTLRGRPQWEELSFCSLAHLVFLSPHPNRTYFHDSPEVSVRWSFMAANLPPRSCSWQVISPCLVNVFTFQSSRGRQRNARAVLAHMVPYPHPLRAGRQQNVEAEARTCTFSSLAVEQQKLFGVISSRKQDAAPLFSHRNISHFKIGKNNMSSYLGRGLQSWARERKRHARQSRMHSCCCNCGHGKEENGGLFHRGYQISKLKVALI